MANLQKFSVTQSELRLSYIPFVFLCRALTCHINLINDGCRINLFDRFVTATNIENIIYN